jgi:hypothetical protein
VKLLGPDYAKGQRAGLTPPPIDVSNPAAPAGYDPVRQQQDLATLQASPDALTSRLSNLTYSSASGLSISAGHHGILKGNVGEMLARPFLDQALAEVRKQHPDAQLFLGVTALLAMIDKSGKIVDWTDPVLFTDGIIGVIEPGGFRMLAVAEIKSGEKGGIQGQEQVHRWIEKHSTFGVRIILPGVGRSFEISNQRREVLGMSNARRYVIVPSDAKFAGLRSGHGTAAAIVPLRMAQSTAEIAYLTAVQAQRLLLEDQARQILTMSNDRPLQPAIVESTLALQEAETITRLQNQSNENKGLALVDGILYRVGMDVEGRSIQRVPAKPLQLPMGPATNIAQANTPTPALPPGAVTPGGNVSSSESVPLTPNTPLLPPPGAAGRPAPPLPVPGIPGQVELAPGTTIPTNVINVSGQDISVQGRVVQPSQPVELREGDIVVRGASGRWAAVNALTGQPIAAVYEGGRFYTVRSGRSVITVSPDGRISIGTGLTQIPLISGPIGSGTGAPGTQSRSPAMRGAAAGLGLIAVANEIMGSIGRALKSQRFLIARGKAQINFWVKFGGNPKHRVWNIWQQGPLPVETEADTAVWTNASYPYVVSIDKQSFGEMLPMWITSYRDFVHFLNVATSEELDTIVAEPKMPAEPTAEERRLPRSYFALINARSHDLPTRIDITDIINPLGQRLLGELDLGMREQVAALPEEQRKNIFRLRHGSETALYRSAGGSFNSQPIMTDKQLLGDDPWVRTLNKRRNDRVLVAPANADAQRAAVVSAYLIKSHIDDVLEEVQEGKRPIISRYPQEGDVESFVAGPEPGESRFGETRYYRHPNWPEYKWTVAIGELTQFWVDERDLAPVALQDIDKYAKGSTATSKP